ncbi:MAG: TetR/AcrR family transcriptional regulator [Clostridia bacterium]|nr:TetR/AcrR family transcriptional regulator [Clostridia bacterium]
MNKTKRKIFETSMKLFAEKGYDATSVEEITATVGVAKGTLYYHFSSKEEIFNFLVEEGMKLLHNSVEIKTENLTNSIDKIKAVILIQLKVMKKYDEFITILLSQIWGNEPRHQQFRKYIYNYINTIESLIIEGIENGTFHKCDTRLIAESIFGMICPIKIYKLEKNEELENEKIVEELMNSLIRGIIK